MLLILDYQDNYAGLMFMAAYTCTLKESAYMHALQQPPSHGQARQLYLFDSQDG